jgi:hypothetical protein
MTKVIKIDDRNYKRLLMIIHELECASNERASFDDALSLLIDEHERKKEQKINRGERVTK